MLACLAGMVPSTAHANDAAVSALKQAIKKGMEHYGNLDLDAAVKVLQTGIAIAKKANYTGPLLARTYLRLGLMLVVKDEPDKARESFRAGLKIKPDIEVDNKIMTPKAQRFIKETRKQLKTETPKDTPKPVAAIKLTDAQVHHDPPKPTEPGQSLDLIVKLDDKRPVFKTILYYRHKSISGYNRVIGEVLKAGVYSNRIPSMAVKPGTILYFIEVRDMNGKLMAMRGDPQSPYRIKVKGKESPLITGPKKKRKHFLFGLKFATGFGFISGATDVEHLEVEGGSAFTPLAFELELGYIINQSIAIMMRNRLQLIHGAYMMSLRAAWSFLSTKTLKLTLSGGLAVGKLRHRLSLEPLKPGNDSVTGGTAGFSLGFGMDYFFTNYLALAVDLNLDGLFPNSVFNIDLSVGCRFYF